MMIWMYSPRSFIVVFILQSRIRMCCDVGECIHGSVIDVESGNGFRCGSRATDRRDEG
jgi:hypothetical protein